MAEGDSAGQARGWFVQAAGKVWGPYPEARIQAFVAEGRVAAETLLGVAPEGPFHPAARHGRLSSLFGDPVEAHASPASPVAEAAPAYAPTPARPLLVWAGLKSQKPERFEQALAAHGPFVRIGADLWLVRARTGASALRNALTRRIGSDDALMVVEAPLEQAAWFNLAGDADRTMRQLWAAQG